MRRLTLILVFSLLAGCTREPTPLSFTGEQLMVHSLLVAGADTVQVLLTRTLPEPIPDVNAPGGFIHSRPVSAADVRLLYDGTELQLREAPEGFPACFSIFPYAVPRADSIKPGCYAAVVSGGIRSDQRYRLEVRVNGGGIVEGSTEVPRAPRFRELDGRARFPLVLGPIFDERPAAVIPVRYEVPPQVAGVRLALSVDSLYRGGRREPQANCSFNIEDREVRRTAPTDSATLIIQAPFCSRADPSGRVESFTPDSIFAHVTLAGYDSTYVRFAEAAGQDSAERSKLQAGITGALGLFAGAGITSQPIVLVPSGSAGPGR